MARRHPGGSLITAATSNSRHPRTMLVATMLILLVAVLFAVFRILPEGGMERLRPGRADKMLRQAVALERQSLYRSAAEIYAGVVANARAESPARYQAALRLARIQQDELGEPKAAEAVLERAWQLAPDAEEQNAVAARLQAVRGYPIEPTTLTQVSARVLFKSDLAAQTQSTEGRNVVAQIGWESVTLEDLLFAWSQSHANRPPEDDAFGSFVRNYLDQVLLADAAARLGLERHGRASLELRMNRIVSLSRAMHELLINKLPNPTEAQLREYYAAHAAEWTAPLRGQVGHIVVADAQKVEAVRRALEDGDGFAAVARQFSLDAKILPEGHILGEVGENDEAVPHVGVQRGLASFLCSLDAGETTGPLKLERGYHWFKVLKKQRPTGAAPFETVRGQVTYRYQAGQLAQARSALLDQLRSSRPIILHRSALGRLAGAVAEPPAMTATDGTTVTRDAEAAGGE